MNEKLPAPAVTRQVNCETSQREREEARPKSYNNVDNTHRQAHPDHAEHSADAVHPPERAVYDLSGDAGHAR